MQFQQNFGEEGYLALLEHILNYGNDKTDRTGTGTRSIFGAQLRFPLDLGFPMLTTKKVFARGVFSELCWLIHGETNIKSLLEDDVHIWDEWADENGDLGPVYGEQWRNWGDTNTQVGWPSNGIDQLQNAVDLIQNSPDSRRIVVTAWNPTHVPAQALPACHMTFQFEVHDGQLSCHMYMRSADVFLGVPFNIASYAALTHLIAQITGLEVGDLIVSFGDVHIYKNHFVQVREQLTREPRALPTLAISPGIESLDQKIHYQDFILMDYDPWPAIKAEVAV